MANKILNLIFKADASDATAEMNKLKGTAGGGETGAGGTGILGVTSSLKAMVQPAIALGASVIGIGVILKAELDQYTNYVTEVGRLASALGVTVEEASTLTSLMEGHGVSEDTMVAIFRKMTTEGIDPTLESLQGLLDKYDELEGLEQSEFINQMFGEQGRKEIIPMWEEMKELGIDILSNQQTGLQVTKDMVTEVGKLKQATSLVTTEWDTLTGQLIEGVIPTIITIGQYIYIAMEYSKRLREYLTGIGSGGDATIRPGSGTVTSFGQETTLPGYQDPRGNRPGGNYRYAAGGAFTVGGAGGADTTPVGFMATPGETVSIGGGTSDMENILSEVRRLVDSLPIAVADAVERR